MKPNQAMRNICSKIIIVIPVAAITLSRFTRGTGVDIGSADKTLTSFDIEWKEGE